MSGDVEPAQLAAFLRDVVEATTRHQRTIAEQTRDGFVAWCHEAAAFDGVRSPYLDNPEGPSTTFLEVSRPGPQPTAPIPDGEDPKAEADEELLRRHKAELDRWHRHRDLYDELFAARTPPDAMELVVATGLLVGSTDRYELRRHLVTAPAEVTLDRSSGTLRVELSDAMLAEINWTPGEIRERLVEDQGALRELVDAQSQAEAEAAVRRLSTSFGTQGGLLDGPKQTASHDVVRLGAHPAVLLRKRDASALLQLLREMADDMADGGYISDAFQMLVNPRFEPPRREVQSERATLPLPANIDQRAMIDRARLEPHMVIQGPPGTGKTHTIANLAAVLMAEGRRVLITAENERALTEVQSKLPPSMRALMLPMLHERGTGSLEASVNALSSRAGTARGKDEREREIDERMGRLFDLESRIEKAERQLAQVARADREDRTFGRTTMRVSGHQQVLAGEADRLHLVDRYLAPDGHASPTDAATVLELTPLVDAAHEQMRQFDLPVDLKAPGDLAVWLQDHRAQLAILGDPGEYDHSELEDRVDDLVRLPTMLQSLPPTSWSEITTTTEAYTAAADRCASVAGAIDHGVTVQPPRGRPTVIATLEAYLALAEERFDQPIDDLLVQHDRARSHASAAPSGAELSQHQRSSELTRACEAVLALLARDRSRLLAAHVVDHRTHGRSGIDALVHEAEGLLPGARAPLGLPVEVDDGAPPAHELFRQAQGLAEYLRSGGKLKRLLGTPRPVKDAAELLAHVRIDGSPIDTLEEASRALEFFGHRKTVALIDAWAADHSLERPSHVTHAEWLTAITEMPASSLQVQQALRIVDDVVRFPFGSAPQAPADLLRAALATVSAEVCSVLADLAQAASEQGGEVRIAGMGVRSRAEAEQALDSLRACELRERHHDLLPRSWAARCNPVDVDGDVLVDMLRVCAAAAAVPGRARTADLTPTAVNRIVERAQVDVRRNQLRDEHERVIGGLRRRLAACVPMSPATRAIDEALAAEKPGDYRVAMDELERERDMADRATQLERARVRLAQVHPALVAAFDTGDPLAAEVLRSLEDLQQLRDHRATAERWKAEIGSSEEIHAELAALHRQFRRVEAELAGLRCWSSAIDRLQSRRELRSALSALTIAMDKVPKTRTAKSYPARMRALRAATKDAAPAIPCWVMAIDRVAEVLGYPRGEDRFDVVIIDESSQAWFPAMFLYAIADQVIVVGDDLQTSPSQVVNESEIRSIVDQHIAGHRLADQVGSDLSLYDVAAVMTGPDTMVDHFRCVPEIIDLSNRLSYEPKGKRLLASRVREPGSLEPIKHVQVSGWRRGSAGANEEEVRAIVEQVARCHADPAYSGMDFGVVVVGTTPSAHVKSLVTQLLDELGPTAMEQRNLEVGTPSQFQGAERNVMFLSLVDVAPEGGRLRKWPHEHTGANRKRVQQLNVAVSRARDQLWIFRSFDASSLAPDDARTIILESATAELPSLKDQLDACDSQFERDVVMSLASADPDLLIRTQVEAIGYSIDIVVEDQHGHRLAIECDGDRWHTSEDRIRSDLYRQRTLEDIGWRFVRFLASEWYDDPAERTRDILEHYRALAGSDAARAGGTRASRSEEARAGRADDPSEPVDGGGDEERGPASGEHGEHESSGRAASLPTWWTDAEPDDEEALWPDDAPTLSGDLPMTLFNAEPSQPIRAWSTREPSQPTGPVSPKEANRLLAEAMRGLGIEPNGEAWVAAKEAVASGATPAAAALAARDRVGIVAREETLTCEACGSDWTRQLVRGRKPRFCPDCT